MLFLKHKLKLNLELKLKLNPVFESEFFLLWIIMLLGWAIFVASACITAFYIFSTNNANAPKIKLEEIAIFKSRSLVFSTTTEIGVKDSLINGSDIIRREPIVARGISSLSLVSDILSNMSKSSILDNVLINGEANDPSLFVTEDVQPGLSFLHELPNNWEYSIVEDSVNYSSFMSRGQEKHHHAFFNSDLSNFPQVGAFCFLYLCTCLMF